MFFKRKDPETPPEATGDSEGGQVPTKPAVVMYVNDRKPTNRRGLYGTVFAVVVAFVPVFADYILRITGYDITPILKSIGTVFGIGH